MRVNDAVPGMLLLALSLAGLWLASGFPSYGADIGPAFFPFLILVVLGGCAVTLIVKGLAAAGPWVELDAHARSVRFFGTLLVLLGAILFYIALADRLGFVPAGTVAILVPLLWARGWRRLPVSLLIALVAAVVLWVIFARFLRVPLPLGLMVHLPVF